MRFFQLADHIGVDPFNGSLQPFVEEGMSYIIETKRPDGTWVQQARVVKLLPVIAGSRITGTDDERVADLLEVSGSWREIDMPRSLRPRRPRESLSPGRRR
jgi:hypothetical protein